MLKTLSDDPRLAVIVEAWADLPEAVRVGILAMVEAAGKARARGEQKRP